MNKKTILSLAVVTILALGLFPAAIPAAEAVGLKVEPKTVAPGTSVTVTIEPNTFQGQTVFAFISPNGLAGPQNNTALFGGRPQVLPNDVGSEENVIVPVIPPIPPGTYWIKLWDGAIWRVSPALVVKATGIPSFFVVDNKVLGTRFSPIGTPARYLDGLGWIAVGFGPGENLDISATGSLDILVTEDENGNGLVGEASDIFIELKGARESRGGRSIIIQNGTAGTHVLIAEGTVSQLRASASVIIQPTVNVTMPRFISAQGGGAGYSGFNRFDQTTFSAAIFENKTIAFWVEGHGWDASVALNSISLFSNITNDIVGTLAPDKTIMKETNSKGYFGTFYSATLSNLPTPGLYYMTVSMGGLSTRSELFILAADASCNSCPPILPTARMAKTSGPIGMIQAAYEDRWVEQYRFQAFAYGFEASSDIGMSMTSGAISVGAIIIKGSNGGLGTTDKRGAFITYRTTDSDGTPIIVGNTNDPTNDKTKLGISAPYASLANVNTGQNSSEPIRLNLLTIGTNPSTLPVQVQSDVQYTVIPMLVVKTLPITFDGDLSLASASIDVGMSLFMYGTGFPNTFRATSIQVGIQTYSIRDANSVGSDGIFNSREGDDAGERGFISSTQKGPHLPFDPTIVPQDNSASARVVLAGVYTPSGTDVELSAPGSPYININRLAMEPNILSIGGEGFAGLKPVGGTNVPKLQGGSTEAKFLTIPIRANVGASPSVTTVTGQSTFTKFFNLPGAYSLATDGTSWRKAGTLVPGEILLVNGTGFASGAKVTISFISAFLGPDNSPLVRLGEVLSGGIVQGEGFISTIVRVPNVPIPGNYFLIAEAKGMVTGGGLLDMQDAPATNKFIFIEAGRFLNKKIDSKSFLVNISSGQSFTIEGVGFEPGDPVVQATGLVFTGRTHSKTFSVAVASVDSNGRFLLEDVTAPRNLPLDEYEVTEPAGTVSMVLTILPSVSTSPETGPPGTVVTIKGSGFEPLRDYKVWWDTQVVSARLTTDTNGNFAVEVSMPAVFSGEGPHAIAVTNLDAPDSAEWLNTATGDDLSFVPTTTFLVKTPVPLILTATAATPINPGGTAVVTITVSRNSQPVNPDTLEVQVVDPTGASSEARPTRLATGIFVARVSIADVPASIGTFVVSMSATLEDSEGAGATTFTVTAPLDPPPAPPAADEIAQPVQELVGQAIGDLRGTTSELRTQITSLSSTISGLSTSVETLSSSLGTVFTLVIAVAAITVVTLVIVLIALIRKVS
ncbi:MAG: hypothetical protein IH932_01120 [Thaumarchaeota archaeon]|nr:hypothetical protein [Nitrososphaerota archaeon]